MRTIVAFAQRLRSSSSMLPNIHDYIVVACAGCCSLLTNASECISDFRAGTGPSGPHSVTCLSGPFNQVADGRIHFY